MSREIKVGSVIAVNLHALGEDGEILPDNQKRAIGVVTALGSPGNWIYPVQLLFVPKGFESLRNQMVAFKSTEFLVIGWIDLTQSSEEKVDAAIAALNWPLMTIALAQEVCSLENRLKVAESELERLRR
jgi:hypothetical protein